MSKITINNKEIETDHYIKKWIDWALNDTKATDDKEITKNVQWLYKHADLDKPKVIIFRDYDKFINYEWSSVSDSVGVSVSDSVSDSVDDSVSASVGAWYWADDMAFADIFCDTKVLDKKKIKELQKIKKILSTQRLAVYTEKICYVLVAPKIRRNEQGQLHSTTKRAVDWGKSGIYYLNGVEFNKEWWAKISKGELSAEEIFAIDNIEHRRVAYELMDKTKMVD